ncbi:MAG: M1 family metallopeptidase, partial [Acidobacteria bacterium]|nr:M1 family metallopeptidase [Acidobacteriota bacterium]
MPRLRRSVLLIALLLVALTGLLAMQSPAQKLRPPFGDPRAAPHWPRSRTYDLEHIKVELSFDWEKKEVAGTATLTLAPLADGLVRVTLDAAEMSVEQVGLANGQKLDFAADGDQVTILLDRAYAAGELVTFSLRYRTRPRKGLYFVLPDAAYPNRPRQIWTQGESDYNHYWIPLYDFPNDKATSEMIATVPAEMTAISNGRLVEVREDRAAGTKTFHWREEVLHVTYLISLVVGRLDQHSQTVEGLSLDTYVPPGTDKAPVGRSFEQTGAMVRFFGDYIGIPYPYEKYAQTTVEEFLWGGMENVSATTLYADTLHDEAAAPNWTSEGLVAHELVHQWWGDLLTCRDWSHIWLNEAFATFFTNLWYEQHYGRDEYDYRRWEDARDYFKEDREEYRRPIVMPVYVSHDDLFDSHSYPKGGLVLSMLRALLGDDEFQGAIRHYGKKHAQ